MQLYFYPYVPKSVTVHLGAPDEPASNVTVDFIDYIKNVASSEIYPTWPQDAIRANILAQITYTLNRIYTSYYPSRGYPFDITSSTAYDQAFVYGREIFKNISDVTDEIVNNYIVRQDSIAPLFAAYCNGTTATCNGLSQWGSAELARNGYSYFDILKYYYGNDIQILSAPQLTEPIDTFPGTLVAGDSSNAVSYLQIMLNRISRNYPAIQRINDPDGLFGADTERAVRTFQQVFNLDVDAIVGRATWNKVVQIYGAVKRLGELNAEALSYSEVAPVFPIVLARGDSGVGVETLQYYLAVIGFFDPDIPLISIDGTFGSETAEAVAAFQKKYGLEPDSIVGNRTWRRITEIYNALSDYLGPPVNSAALYPGYILYLGMQGPDVTLLQGYLQTLSENFPWALPVTVDGIFGTETEQAVMSAQNQCGLTQNGLVNASTWNCIARRYDDLF